MAKPGEPRLERRDFLKSIGMAGATAAIPVAADAQMSMPAPHPGGAVYLFFNPDEQAFIEAAVDTLIPADPVGPGALESGVAIYIDRQLGGAFGNGARLYMQGPFAPGTPQQGYQLPLLPKDLIRAGIADTGAWCQATRKKLFADLALGERASVMTEVETGKANFPTVPPATFFNLLLQLTVEGYFADPAYGGNKDKGAWKMLGFPGAGGMYADEIEAFRNKPYPNEPKSIRDLV